MFALSVSACNASPSINTNSIEITDAWVRSVPSSDGMGMNAALYLTITNHRSAPDTLVGVQSEFDTSDRRRIAVRKITSSLCIRPGRTLST